MLQSHQKILSQTDQPPRYTFNRKLKEIPENVRDWSDYLKQQKEKLARAQGDDQELALLEKIGYAARVLMRLDEAEDYLLKAMALSFFHPQKTKLAQNLMRLAHVYQWKNNFAKTHLLLDQAKRILNGCRPCESLMATYHQHLGKAYFDQGYMNLAQCQFELALKMRCDQKMDTDLIASTEHCLDVLQTLNKDDVHDDLDIFLRRAEIFDADDMNSVRIKLIGEEFHTYPKHIDSQFCAVVECNGKIEGFCQVAKNGADPRSAHIFGLYLTPVAQGPKIGHQVMNLISEYCDFAEIDQMTLISSAKAFEFYRKQGFIPSGS